MYYDNNYSKTNYDHSEISYKEILRLNVYIIITIADKRYELRNYLE